MRELEEEILVTRKKGATGPGENLVAPKCGCVVEVLHERIMAPETHAINHSPFKLILILITGILENVSVVIGEGMPSDASFGATVGAR